jgi:hypothetical protein
MHVLGAHMLRRHLHMKLCCLSLDVSKLAMANMVIGTVLSLMSQPTRVHTLLARLKLSVTTRQILEAILLSSCAATIYLLNCYLPA